VAGERVLVVDDRRDNIEFVVDYVLKPNGYEVLTAKDGAEGLRRALTENPDLIIMDNNMPKMIKSGFSVRALRRPSTTS
jgi:two-component system alkaline phosphatase synthesis response regulator PhoP